MSRHVYTNRELPHIWTTQRIEEGHNGNRTFYFQGKSIFSYGSHFKIAQIIVRHGKDRGVVFNSRSYSTTTSQHQAGVRRAIPGDWEVYTVPNLHFGLSRKEDRYQHGQNVRYYKAEIGEYLSKCARARSASNKEWLHSKATALHAEALAYAVFFSLKPPKLPTIPELNSSEMEKLRARESAASAKKAAANRKAEEERRKEALSLAEQWRAGISIQRYGLLNTLPTMLRLVGYEVETSHGAKFPITHAKRGLTLVRAVMARGELWTSNGHSCRLGHYGISRIEPDGTVTAGCHRVTWVEIDRVAQEIEDYQPTIKCDQCQMLSINGLPCHETGCPNSRKLWDEDSHSFVAVQEENEDDVHT